MDEEHGTRGAAPDGTGRAALGAWPCRVLTCGLVTPDLVAFVERSSADAYERAPVGVHSIGPDGVFLNVNATELAWLGYAREEVVGQLRLADLCTPASRVLLEELSPRLEETGSALNVELELVRKDGSILPVLASATAVHGPDGKHAFSRSVVVDRTGRQAEERLRERERFIERVFHATPDAMYVFDLAERRVVFANRDLASLAGYSKEESQALGGDLLQTLLHPDDLALYEKNVARFETASDEDVHETLFRARHKDGAWRWLLGRGLVFDRSADGRPARILSVVKDVTDRKVAEDALRESEAFHRALAEAVPVGIAVMDDDYRITWSSPAFRELLGASSDDEVVGTRFSGWVSPASPWTVRNQRRTPRKLARLVRPREVRLRRRNGPDLWVNLVSAPLFHADGRFRGAILAAQDITEERAANAELKRSTERLQHLSRRVVEVQEEERRHVARELHDEIGQSLAAIFFRLEAFLHSHEPAPRSLIEDSIEIADRTMKAVRDLALDLHPSILDEAGLANALRAYVDRQVRVPGLDVSLSVCPSVERLPRALRSALYRIAQSALTNVVRHSRARAVQLEAAVKEGFLELVVRDDGVGFDLDAAPPDVSSGMSLGLLVMRERAELVGGTIEIESAPGRGTTVTARFPLPAPDADEETS
jgi:PAS domain S-box-containing protein